MAGRKKVRTRGKLMLSRYFQELGEGNRVALVREASIKCPFPKRMQGRTGIVIGKRGRAYVVLVNDLNMEKTFVITPIHLKKLSSP